MSDIAATAYAPPATTNVTAAPSVTFKYAGTGGELFKELFVGYLLTIVTVGIYLPWFIVKLNKYFYSRTTMQTSKGAMTFDFTGTGGDLFVKGLVGYLLTIITLGIYGAWFVVDLIKWNADSSTAQAEDGNKYRLNYQGTGGELFVTLFVGYLLTAITLGIYLPWFMCKLNREISSKMTVLTNDQSTGNLEFLGEGGTLFGTFIVGWILTAITFGIYGPWFNVSITKFMQNNMRVKNNGRVFGGDFTGTGGELFVIQLVGTLLTCITLGIYSFWFLTNIFRFQVEKMSFQELRA